MAERLLTEKGFGWAIANYNLPGPNYYDGCDTNNLVEGEEEEELIIQNEEYEQKSTASDVIASIELSGKIFLVIIIILYSSY